MIADGLQRAALATAIGLLLGIERGWQERQAHDGARVAGIRTFTLISLLGALSAFLAIRWSGVVLGLCFIGFALPFGLFEWRRAVRAGGFSATDFVAGLLAFALGAYAVAGDMRIAAAAAVTTTAILAERKPLHTFLRRLKWMELRAALALLVMTAVMLPVLPDRAVDPWGALNPHQIWLMTVLTCAVCYGGYLGVRIAGERRGLLFAAIMGGLATSTTVTWTFARLARKDAVARPAVLASILAAWIVSLFRMTALAGVVAPALIAPLAPPVLVAALPLALFALSAYRSAANQVPHDLKLDNPFDIALVLRFTILLSAIMILSKLFSHGDSQLFALGGVSGLLDVDPVTLSMGKMTLSGLSVRVAATTILIAAAANGVAKAVLGTVFGGWRLGGTLSALALAACAGGIATFMLG